MKLTKLLFPAAVILFQVSIASAATITLDADTVPTGSTLDTTPLVTAYGTITFQGEIRSTGDGDAIAAGSSGNVFDIANSPDSTAEMTFDFDVLEVTFVYGGNNGVMDIEARDMYGAVVDSFFQASTGDGEPAGPVTLSGSGIRSLYWEDPGNSFLFLDNMELVLGDGCNEGDDGSDISIVSAASDGTNIEVHLELCDALDNKTQYKVHFDYMDGLAVDDDRNGDGVVDEFDFCATTSDDTMKYGQRGNMTGPGYIEVGETNVPGDTLWYTVSYEELGLAPGDLVLIWADAHFKNRSDRVPNTDGTDGCDKPEILEETIPLILASPVFASGTFPVRGTFGFDLDLGAENPTLGVGTLDPPSDVWFVRNTPNDSDFAPLNGALIAIFGPAQPDLADCTAAPVSNATVSFFALDPIAPSTWLCAMTDEGRYSAFRVFSGDASPIWDAQNIVIEFVTWP